MLHLFLFIKARVWVCETVPCLSWVYKTVNPCHVLKSPVFLWGRFQHSCVCKRVGLCHVWNGPCPRAGTFQRQQQAATVRTSAGKWRQAGLWVSMDGWHNKGSRPRLSRPRSLFALLQSSMTPMRMPAADDSPADVSIRQPWKSQDREKTQHVRPYNNIRRPAVVLDGTHQGDIEMGCCKAADADIADVDAVEKSAIGGLCYLSRSGLTQWIWGGLTEGFLCPVCMLSTRLLIKSMTDTQKVWNISCILQRHRNHIRTSAGAQQQHISEDNCAYVALSRQPFPNEPLIIMFSWSALFHRLSVSSLLRCKSERKWCWFKAKSTYVIATWIDNTIEYDPNKTHEP